MIKTLAALLLIASVALTASCRKKADERAIEKAIEKQSGGKVKADISKGQVTFKSKEGEMTITSGGGAKVPEGFPKDVLVYRGAEVLMSAKERDSFTVMLTTGDNSETVAEAYKKAMKSEGWEEETSLQTPQGVGLTYKKEKRIAIVNITKDDKKTQISLHVSTEE